MSYNIQLKQSSLNKITKKLFKEALFLCYKDGITSVAPLGFSGDTILLHQLDQSGSRPSQVSIRNYCNNAELLITDSNGGFLFHGRFDINLGINFVVNQYWAIFKMMKPHILKNTLKISDFKKITIPEDCQRTVGFKMLHAFQKQNTFTS